MPDPTPWSDVETMIKAGVGVRETARQLGLDEERVKRQATRKGWSSQAPSARLVAAAEALEQVRAEVVPNVPKAGDALANTLLERHGKSKLGLSKYVARVSESVGDEGDISQVHEVKALADIMAKVWPEQQGGTTVNVAIALRMDMD
jgi:hypothetical protein